MIKNRINGFSMIELLISLLVASIVIMGIFSFVSSTQRSFNFVQANDGMNRSMQMTNRNITDYINMAGFRNFRRVYDGILMKKRDYVFDSGAEIEFALNSFLGSDAPQNSQTHGIYIRYYGSSIDDDQFNSVNNDTTNQRIFDCDGNFLNRKQLAVIHLFIDGNNGLRCEQIIDTENDDGEVIPNQRTTGSFLINPDIRYMMFSFREDGNSEFLLPYEIEAGKSSSSDKGKTLSHQQVLNRYANINGIKFGFVTRQSTHQKIKSLRVNSLVYHLLGDVDGKDDKVEIPQNDGESEHDLYNLITGIIYTKNRYVEENM